MCAFANQDLWGKGVPAYASTGLTRGFRLYLFFKRPTGQRRAHAIARRLAALAQEAGLGRTEVFPSSPEAGRGKAVFLPYFGYLTPSGGNPLLYPDLTPVPLERLPRLKRLDPDRNALARLRLEGIYRRIAQAPKGERHNTLARLAPLAFTLGPEEKVAEGLRKAAAQAGLPDTDPDEVERVLAWARERAKKGGRREGEGRPRLLPPDPKHPLFRGRAGQSRYLVLRAIWQVYTAHGWSQDGRPKVQLSYRQIAEGASLSLQTTFKAVKALKEAGVLEGAWSGQAEHGTVWSLDPTAWPGGEEGPEARPLWSPSGLGLTAAPGVPGRGRGGAPQAPGPDGGHGAFPGRRPAGPEAPHRPLRAPGGVEVGRPGGGRGLGPGQVEQAQAPLRLGAGPLPGAAGAAGRGRGGAGEEAPRARGREARPERPGGRERRHPSPAGSRLKEKGEVKRGASRPWPLCHDGGKRGEPWEETPSSSPWSWGSWPTSPDTSWGGGSAPFPRSRTGESSPPGGTPPGGGCPMRKRAAGPGTPSTATPSTPLTGAGGEGGRRFAADLEQDLARPLGWGASPPSCSRSAHPARRASRGALFHPEGRTSPASGRASPS